MSKILSIALSVGIGLLLGFLTIKITNNSKNNVTKEKNETNKKEKNETNENSSQEERSPENTTTAPQMLSDPSIKKIVKNGK